MNRNAAVKVLSEAFALDPKRLARFKREAQLLASLNHPNILASTDWNKATLRQPHATPLCAVLELIEGPTLQEIRRGAQGRALPLEGSVGDCTPDRRRAGTPDGQRFLVVSTRRRRQYLQSRSS